MNRFKIMAAKPGTDMHTAALLHHEQGLGNPTEEHIKLAIAVWPFLFFVFCFLFLSFMPTIIPDQVQ